LLGLFPSLSSYGTPIDILDKMHQGHSPLDYDKDNIPTSIIIGNKAYKAMILIKKEISKS
jgi:hypothetical protein